MSGESRAGDERLGVTAIVTCFNEGAFIMEAVRSILNQTRSDLIDEVIVLDDGSQAETLAVLAQVETIDPRVRVIYGPGGARQAAQRNKGVAAAASPLVAFLDGDDLWAPRRIERQVELFARDPGLDLVYADFYAFSADLESARRAGVLDITRSEDLVMTFFMNDPPILPSTVLMRADAYRQVGGMDAAIACFEETDFYLRLAKTSRFGLVDEPLLYKRNRQESVTGGRKDLMAYHAFVAFKAAADEPRLLRLAPKRLAERARKLGNHKFLLGDDKAAAELLRLATRLDMFNWRAWATYIGSAFFARPINYLFGRRLKARRAALGIQEP
ncbi:glycosyltransferase family 2 protein [Caulobacter sp.]|uniref:glycosyltransferase family 2 protein n=1 Tax=Caulobacter sp. TaxID=78 RepID=UPI003BAE660B